MTNHIIVCSHGFGVKKDDRGLFPDATAEVHGAKTLVFDYNRVDENTNTITVGPFSEQVRILGEVLAEIKAVSPDAVVDLVCHSQGTIAPAILRPKGVRKVVLLAPAKTLNQDRIVNRFKDNPGSKVDLEGETRLARQDGTVTIVPKSYWPELHKLDPVELYNEWSKTADITIINANQDAILGSAEIKGLASEIKVLNLDGDHNFNGADRAGLKRALKEILA